MPDLLYVVAREEGDLFASLHRAFADESSVAVVLDRRLGERRQRRDVQATDRRRRDRRALDVTGELSGRGWALIHR